jgi:intracellular sulfur oxidation DsrE/DsrF family protein
MSENSSSPFARRLFLTQVGSGMTVLAASAAASPAIAAQSTATSRWQPEHHPQDDWLDQLPGKHRLVFDTTQPDGLGSALTFATNYYLANNSGYGLQNADLAVVIIARHFTTPFAYNDSIWEKYGAPISNFIGSGKEPTTRNTYGRQVTALVARGAHFAVCQMATRAIAGAIASAVSKQQEDVYTEIAANLLPNSHLVPAGIVAVNRAQERGYTLVHGG